LQPWGAINPMTELQAQWVVRVLKGERKLPSRVEMDKDTDERLSQMSKRYVASPRHTIQVDYVEFCNKLADEVGCRPNTCEINRWYVSYYQIYLLIFSTLFIQ
jgi:dimethylaniline monooxygenase (N-oxide forming)